MARGERAADMMPAFAVVIKAMRAESAVMTMPALPAKTPAADETGVRVVMRLVCGSVPMMTATMMT